MSDHSVSGWHDSMAGKNPTMRIGGSPPTNVWDATTPAVAPDAQRYDWRGTLRFIDNYAENNPAEAEVEVYDATDRLAAYIERLEAERDALLAEHEAVRPGIEWGELTPSGAMFFPPTTTLRG